MKMIKSGWEQFKHYRPLMEQLVIKDIKLKYRRSFLGYVWSILNPLMIMIIMVIVFSQMFRFDIENYPVYFIIGSTLFNFMTDSTTQAMWSITGNAALLKKTYVPKYIFTLSKITSYFIIGSTLFNFMTDSTTQAMWSITGNAALLKKTYVPKYIFTLSKITSSLVNTLFSLGAMLIVFVVCDVHFNIYMLWIIAVLLQVYLFSMGLGLFLAQGTVFFRDIQYIYSAVTTAWTYLTPIFYPIASLPESIQMIIKIFNPMYGYIEQFRLIVLNNTFPDIKMIISGFVIALLSLLIGSCAFLRAQDKFILYI